MRIHLNAALATLVAGAILAPALAAAQPAENLSIADLKNGTHIHGLAVDRKDPSILLVATHHGLYRTGPDGASKRVSVVQDFMGFNPHPGDPGTLYASGHPGGGGNLGFIVSTDEGATWTQISPGLNGPVDFHQMTVSPVDPNTVYGTFGNLQVSRDAGKTWTEAGPPPAGLIDISASAKDAEILYAATETGLFVSLDAGKSWKSILEGVPVTLVEATPDGVYAFGYGRGLLRAAEGAFNWTTLSEGWGERYFLHLAADPKDPKRLFAATGDGQVLASTDQGKNWVPFGQ